MNASLSDGMVKIPRIRLKGGGGSSKKSSSSSSSSTQAPQTQQHINNQHHHHQHHNNQSTKSSGGGPVQFPIHADQIRAVNLKSLGSSSSSSSQQKSQKATTQQQQQLLNAHLHGKLIMMRGGEEEEEENEDGEEEDEDQNLFRVDGGSGSSGVIIKPKKLTNPIKESVAMQSIHRELLLNQKIGRSVLNHKTELQKALEKLASKHQAEEEADCSDDSNESGGGDLSSLAPHPPPLPLSSSKHHHNHSNKRGSSSSSGSGSTNNNKNEFQRILDARAKLIEEQKCFVDGERKRDGRAKESEFEIIHKRITTTQHSAGS